MLTGKTILIAVDAPIVTCPRPKRLLNYLSRLNKVDVLSRTPSQISPAKRNFYLVKSQLSPFEQTLRSIGLTLNCLGWVAQLDMRKYLHNLDDLEQYDLIFVHDIHLLPLFKKVLHKVVFDAREFYPLQNSEDKQWQYQVGRVFHSLCEQYLKHCKVRLTVSSSIVELYEQWLDIPFVLFRSYPDGELPQIDPHQKINRPIKLIHHGGAMPNRRLEHLIDLAGVLGDGFELTLMLMPTVPAYLTDLKKRAAQFSNIRFIAPVAFEHIIHNLTKYDIGIHLMEPQGGNQHEFALPNKFFEFVGAGLMLVVSGSKEMVTLVNQYKTGVGFEYLPEIQEVANVLNQLTDKDISTYKSNSLQVRQDLTFDKEVTRLEQILTQE
ncbi:hypothetical protein N7931_03760 [Catenovulum sp. 2E275]|uniref:hypothetical protein n=1 Tax=Catenovulum sp. 2E275 TaxID=2980497 RepID=UPI0021D3A424|nr:hypothetical protein [Catenovulum sp. 2E275]MCU4674743.1 hypothetical protein [Catenovulum sp. 2E275]